MKQSITKNKKLIIELLNQYLSDPFDFLESNNIDNIIILIKYAADNYYNKNDSVMTDEEYDLLIDTIKKLDPNNSILNEIGAKVTIDKVDLPFFMGSMDKIKPSDSKLLDKFVMMYKGSYIYSDKLDGISGLLYKTNDGLRLYKRGDGYNGSDISHIIPYINLGPNMTIEKLEKIMDKNMAIRGELIMSKDNFKKYSDRFKNARNMVNGIISKKKKEKFILADIDFVSYEIVNPWIPNQETQFNILRDLNINVVHNDKINNKLEFSNLSNLLQERKFNSNNKYEIDGIIISNIILDKDRTIDKNPLYAFAFKDILDNQIAIVKVLDIEWNISKDGYIKPTLLLEPTDIGGVTISRTTGFNAKYIIDNKLGSGAKIKLIRSGDVIPHILEIIKPVKKPQLPEIEYKWSDSKVDIIVIENTSEQLIKELTFFVKKLDIKNLSEQTIKKFVDNGIDTINKIINIKKDDMTNIEGFKDKMIDKIYTNIKDSIDKLTMLELMTASNIFGHGIGEKKIKKLLEKYPNFLDLYTDHSNEELIDIFINIDGYDKITAENFVNGLDDFIDLFNSLKPELRKQLRLSLNKYKDTNTDKINTLNTNNKLANLKIVFSGYRNKEWKKIIELNNGNVSTSVSSNTNLLIAKQEDIDANTNTKIKKAKELGIKILTPEEFEKKYIK